MVLMRVPYAIKGMLFAPALVALAFFLKVICPESPGSGCLSDYLSTPIFLPAIFVESAVGKSIGSYGLEMLVVLLYWALVGLLVGLIFDLRKIRSRY